MIIHFNNNLGQARRLAEEIGFLHNGRVAERAPARRFFAGPATPEAVVLDWIVSPDGQRAIVQYTIGGQQLFFPNAERRSTGDH